MRPQPTGGGAAVGSAGAGLPPNQRRLIVYAVVAIIVIVLVRGLFFHENKYEKIARDVTVALQKNDLATVEKYQNAETATEVNRGIVGRAADKLAPLGSLKRVKEITGSNAPVRGHEFTVTFDRGTVDEKMRLDPQDKIVSFSYDVTAGS
jgi:hypothetical protein